MFYTVRYAHLKTASRLAVGDIVGNNEFIAECGNSGKSDGIHLHIDCVHGSVCIPWRLKDTEYNLPLSCPRQLNYFIDDQLFKSGIEVTTPYCDHEYMEKYGKLHHAYDVVPKDRNSYKIYWNRSKQGRVIANGYDNGYGFYLHISFDI